MNFDFSSLDFNNIGNWPWPFRAVAIVIVCIVAQFGSYKFVLESQQGDLSAVYAKEKQLREELTQKAHKVVHLAKYRQKIEDMKNTFGTMLRQLPDKNEVAELLVDISQSGLSSGLEFELFKPDPELNKGFYAELPINLKVTGTYHEFGRFISEVAGLSRIVTVHDFVIKTEKNNKQERLVLEATAKTYRMLDETEQRNQSNKAKGKKGKRAG